MDVPLRKVTARVDLKARHQPRSRPGSPAKQSPTSSLSPPPFRPRAKINSSATVRKLSSSSSLSASLTNHVSAPSSSRPGSPSRPSRSLANGSEPGSSPKARITARPTSRSGTVQTHSGSLEPRQRALTAASAKLKLPHNEDRPRSGSVIALHHALSISDLDTSSDPTLYSTEPSSMDIGRVNSPPALAPIRIKSKITGLAKSTASSAGDLASRSLSPPYATTRPIHTRSRAPSITSSFTPSELPSTAFYPIAIAPPSASIHRHASQSALSPAHPYPSPTLSSEPYSAKKSPLVPKADPASVPLPPYSPPISALSLSSKSSISRTPVSPNNDQLTDNQASGVASHVKHRSVDWASSPSFSQTDTIAEVKRDRSRSLERGLCEFVHQDEGDAESEGSERQLKVEAKTNRKIADLEITNRSLLAINTSLETTRNRQAKEIRDLRRKLRETRLILPPRTYMAVKSELDEERDGDDEDEGEDDSDVEGGVDETFQRIRGLIDNLIESGKRALEMRPEDFRATLATKVLNADELRSWKGSGQRASIRSGYADKQDADGETIHSHLSPALVAVPDNDSTSSVESEGELASGPPDSSALPPITITHLS